jgi:hypothetical protein
MPAALPCPRPPFIHGGGFRIQLAAASLSGTRRSFYHGTTALSFDMQTMSMRALPHSPHRQWSCTSETSRVARVDQRLEVGVALTLAGPAGEVHPDILGGSVLRGVGRLMRRGI